MLYFRLDPVRALCYDIGMAHEKNPAAVALGRLGGLKGGKKRMEQLSKEERRELGRKAAEARWQRYKERKAAEEKEV